ncbi:MAG: hypothetical protein KAR20_00740 [Candidatus Heimdallarchaeota archaeon]|nr:hypothetical protein [Candidatus Heimdallarchaeota archaeon]
MFVNCNLPWQRDSTTLRKSITLLYKVGYQAAIVGLHSRAEFQEFLKSGIYPEKTPQITLPASIATITSYKMPEVDLPCIPCIVIKASNAQSLKQELGRWAQTRCLIGVESLKKETLEVAARDGRVDMIMCPTTDHIKVLTKGIISLARQNHCFLNISITPIILATHHKRTRILRAMYRLFLSAKPNSNKYVLGSHSEILNDLWLIRGPRESSAILQALFKIPEMHANHILGKHGEELLLRFIKRDQQLFIEPGVEIVDIRKKEEGPIS